MIESDIECKSYGMIYNYCQIQSKLSEIASLFRARLKKIYVKSLNRHFLSSALFWIWYKVLLTVLTLCQYNRTPLWPISEQGKSAKKENILWIHQSCMIHLGHTAWDMAWYGMARHEIRRDATMVNVAITTLLSSSCSRILSPGLLTQQQKMAAVGTEILNRSSALHSCSSVDEFP